MKTIKEIEVTVKYTVKLADIKVPEETYYDLIDMRDSGLTFNGDHCSDGIDWLINNIIEQDACDWEYEIDWIE